MVKPHTIVSAVLAINVLIIILFMLIDNHHLVKYITGAVVGAINLYVAFQLRTECNKIKESEGGGILKWTRSNKIHPSANPSTDPSTTPSTTIFHMVEHILARNLSAVNMKSIVRNLMEIFDLAEKEYESTHFSVVKNEHDKYALKHMAALTLFPINLSNCRNEILTLSTSDMASLQWAARRYVVDEFDKINDSQQLKKRFSLDKEKINSGGVNALNLDILAYFIRLPPKELTFNSITFQDINKDEKNLIIHIMLINLKRKEWDSDSIIMPYSYTECSQIIKNYFVNDTSDNLKPYLELCSILFKNYDPKSDINEE